MADIGHITPREISDEMKESYLDYAMSVIVARALPDVRDGLKPVHRRILYTMHDMGLAANAKFRKSAAIVGDCFVKDTLITTSRGLIPVQEVALGDLVYTQTGLKTVSQLFVMPPRPLLSIRLTNGISVTLTPSQQLKVFTPEGAIVWKHASELNTEDWLVLKSAFPELPEVPLASFRGRRKTLNADIAYVVGNLIADGWVTSDYGTKKHRRLGFCSAEYATMQRIARCLHDEFGYAATIEIKRRREPPDTAHPSFAPLYTLRIHAKELNDYFIREFAIPATFNAATKFIPQRILTSPKAVAASFIAGLFDGDGSVSKRAASISYASVSERLVDQLQILLQQFGVFGQRYAHRPRQGGAVFGRRIKARLPHVTLEINGSEARKFAETIPLATRRKHERLREILNMNPNRLWSNFGTIPYGSRLIFRELSASHTGGGWYRSLEGTAFRMGIRYPGGGKIRYASNLLERPLRIRQAMTSGATEKLERLGSPLGGLLTSLARDGLNFLRVESISPAPAAETYDMQVEGDHEFVANGILAHNCLGKYHPHGDMAVYDAMVRLAQHFSLRYPLVQGQGNFGSVDNDPPAAQRYTEARLTKIAGELLRDIEKETVPFTANYDATREEPSVLPAAIPNLLLNGALGIAVGMATNIPPHNLSEIVNALHFLIQDPDATNDDLAGIVRGPDFPTGGMIFNETEIRQAYASGRGAILMRGTAEIVEKKGANQIIVTEIPYQVNKAELIIHIADLVRDKKIEGIRDIRDESDKEGMQIAIDLKADAYPQKVLNSLYKFTDLEKNFNVNMLALVDGIQPQVLSLKQMLDEYLKHRRTVVTRRTQFDLTRTKERIHILEGLSKALDHIDVVIETIKKSADRDAAHANLKKKFGFSDVQTTAILEMRLQTLAGLERKKVDDELKEKQRIARELEALLKDPKKILALVGTELAALKEQYGGERRTKVVKHAAREIAAEDIIPEEEMIIVLTRGGYIKRIKPEAYRVQKRGGKGVTGIETKEEDVVEHFLTANTHANLLFFTSTGKVFQTKAYEIPEGSRIAKGKAIFNFLSIKADERIMSIVAVGKGPASGKGSRAPGFLVMVTERGMIKKVASDAFDNVRRNGIVAITLKGGDMLRRVSVTSGKDELLLVTALGQAIRFRESDIRPMGRGASGVKAMRLRRDDLIRGMNIITADGGEAKAGLIVVFDQGFAKKTPVPEYKRQKRGGSGIKTGKITPKNGRIVGTTIIKEEAELIAISEKGQVIRTHLTDVPTLGRATQGVRIMKLNPGDRIASFTIL